MSRSGIPASELKRMVKGSQEAHQALQEAALMYLALASVPAVPIHTGARFTRTSNGGWRLIGNPEQHGMADIVACLPPLGRMALIECKTGEARRSPAQVRMHARFSAAGALCLVIRRVTDLEAHVRSPRLKPVGNPRSESRRGGS